MDENEQPALSLEEVGARLRERVAQGRADGTYPGELGDRLDEHVDASGAGPDVTESFEPVHRAIAELRHHATFDPARITTGSRVPGGQAVHWAAGKAVSRQTQGIMQQVQTFAQETASLLASLAALIEDHTKAAHADLFGQLDGILERLADFERSSMGPEGDIAGLRRRVEQLEAAEARRGFHPWFANERFEERFRGSREELLACYRDLAERFKDSGPVLDIGFGRGEFLQLLGEIDVEACGVEVDPALVAAGRERGLDVALGGAVDVLRATPDGGLGGIVLIQVVEHLPSQELLELVVLAVDKLRAGGRLVMETVNPQSLYVFANSFYIDPTHSRPIHPAYLDFLCREAGFGTVETDWRSVPPEEDRLQEVEGSAELNAMIVRLNHLLWGPGDYAIVATR